MTCDEIQPRLSDYLDRSLGEAEYRDVESHLASCPRCRGELDVLKQLVQAVGDLEGIKPPRDFAGTVMERIRAEQQKPSLWERLLGPLEFKIPMQALAVLLVSGVAVYIYLNAERSQVDMLQDLDSLPPRPTAQQSSGAGAKYDDEKPLTEALERQPETADAPAFAPSPPPPLTAGKQPAEESQTNRQPALPVKKSAPSPEAESSRQPSSKRSLPEEIAALPARKADLPPVREMGQEKVIPVPEPPTGQQTSDRAAALERRPLEDRAAGDALEEEVGTREFAGMPTPAAQYRVDLRPFDSGSGDGNAEEKVRALVERLGGQVYRETTEVRTFGARNQFDSETIQIRLPGYRYNSFLESLSLLGEVTVESLQGSATGEEQKEVSDSSAADQIQIRLTLRKP